MSISFEVWIEGKREHVVVGSPRVEDGDPLTVRYPIEEMSDNLCKHLCECSQAEMRKFSDSDKDIVLMHTAAEDLTIRVETDIEPSIRVCGYYYDPKDERNTLDVEVTLEIEKPERKRIYEYTLKALGRAMSLI